MICTVFKSSFQRTIKILCLGVFISGENLYAQSSSNTIEKTVQNVINIVQGNSAVTEDVLGYRSGNGDKVVVRTIIQYKHTKAHLKPNWILLIEFQAHLRQLYFDGRVKDPGSPSSESYEIPLMDIREIKVTHESVGYKSDTHFIARPASYVSIYTANKSIINKSEYSPIEFLDMCIIVFQERTKAEKFASLLRQIVNRIKQ